MPQLFAKGDKVFRYYIAEPSYIYGNSRHQEKGVVLGDPVEYDGKLWIPVKWEYSNGYPSLALVENIYLWLENTNDS